MSVCMGIGAYALIDATMRERAADAAQASQVQHCQRVNALVIAEFDDIIAHGKFPTDAQHDRWKGLTGECKEETK